MIANIQECRIQNNKHLVNLHIPPFAIYNYFLCVTLMSQE